MAIQWNQVKPDFSGSSTSMKNAMTGISQAGTVFDKMRQTMLDEEQRAAENAYKDAQLAQAQNQFELSLAETNRANLAKEQHQADALAVTKAANDALAKYRKDTLAIQQANLQQNKLEQEFNTAFGTYQTASPEQKAQIKNQLTINLQSKDAETVRKAQSLLNTFNLVDGLASDGKVPTQANLYQAHNNGLASYAGKADYKAMADAEKARLNTVLDVGKTQQEIRNKDATVINNLATQLNLSPEAIKQMQALASAIREKESNADLQVVLPAVIAQTKTTGEIFGSKNDFDDTWGLGSDLDMRKALDSALTMLSNGVGLMPNTKVSQKVKDYVADIAKRDIYQQAASAKSPTQIMPDTDMLYETLERLGIPIIE